MKISRSELRAIILEEVAAIKSGVKSKQARSLQEGLPLDSDVTDADMMGVSPSGREYRKRASFLVGADDGQGGAVFYVFVKPGRYQIVDEEEARELQRNRQGQNAAGGKLNMTLGDARRVRGRAAVDHPAYDWQVVRAEPVFRGI